MSTVIELFSGGGGAATGLAQAGWRHLACVEWDREACGVARRLGLPVVRADVGALPLDVRPDLVWASPPCFPAGTLIETATGAVPIERLEAGIEVLTHSGRFCPVVRTMVTPNAPLVRITTRGGAGGVTCTPDHPIYVRRGRAPEWIAASDVAPGDRLLVPHIRLGASVPPITYRRSVSVGGRGAPRQATRDTPIDIDLRADATAWVLGLYLAEGHLRGHDVARSGPTRRCVEFSVAKREADDVSSRLLAAGFDAKAQDHTQSCVRFSVQSLSLWAVCRLFGKGASRKQVPSWCWSMSRAWLASLLDGYMFGDGCTRPNNGGGLVRSATTVSRDLANAVARLAALIEGVVPSVRLSHRAGPRVILGRAVQIRDTWQVRWCPATDRPRRNVVDENGAWCVVRRVVPIAERATVYNIEVAEDHTYTADGYAVHNCQPFSSAGKRAGKGDERDGFPWMFAALDRLRPTWLLIEQVPGLTQHSGTGCGDPATCPGCYLEREILPTLRSRFASVDYRIINAADHGAPQARRRLIFACGPRRFRWPDATHSLAALARAKADGSYWRRHGVAPQPLTDRERAALDGDALGLDDCAPWRTVRDALGAMGGLREDRGSGMIARHGPVPDHSPDTPSPTIGAGSATGGAGARFTVVGAGTNPHGPDAAHERTERDLTDAPATTVTAEQIGNAGPWVLSTARVPYNDGKNGHGAESSGDGPARAVRSCAPPDLGRELDESAYAVTGQDASPTANRRGDVHAQARRRLSPAECALLQAWPEVIPALAGCRTKSARYRVIGNSVVPAVARALGLALLEIA